LRTGAGTRDDQAARARPQECSPLDHLVEPHARGRSRWLCVTAGASANPSQQDPVIR
jgi:hypothetical protein